MALRITYFDGCDTITRQCYGVVMGSAAVTLTATSADLGVVPPGAAVARMSAGEDCLVSNNGTAASATNGVFLSAGSAIDMAVPASGQFKGRTS